MNTKRISLALALFALLAPAFAHAQKAVVAKAPIKPADGFRAEFFANLDDVQEKILALAEATPAEKYGWRPASDVRSISEVYMHIAGSNYVLLTFVGVPAPKTNGDLEKTVTTKREVLAELRRSFDHLRAEVNAMPSVEKPVKMYGKPTTARAVLVMILSHLHEHLGQSIAYARMNGVVPPWSR
jgi:uncharacterized damage-inducible protein DinB